MSRRLVLSFSIIFVIIPFILILVFGGAFISETIFDPASTELLGSYSAIMILSLLAIISAIVYFFLFAMKIDKTPDVKWLVIGTFMGFIIYIIIFLFSTFEVIELKTGFLSGGTEKLLNELLFLPLILVPFTLVLPLFGFSKLYLTVSKSGRGSIII